MNHSHNYWDDWNNVVKETEKAIALNDGQMPTNKHLEEMGLSSLLSSLSSHNWVERFRDKFGYSSNLYKDKKSRGYWDNWDTVVRETTIAIAENNGLMLSYNDLQRLNLLGMQSSLARNGWTKRFREKFGYADREVKESHLETTKKCLGCMQTLPIEDFRLSTDKYRSSYCLNCEKVSNKTIERLLQDKVRNIRRECKNKGLDFNLTYEYLLMLYHSQQGKCNFTGLEFSWTGSTLGKRNPYTPSIHRITPTEGYIKSNIRMICWALNIGIGEFPIINFEVVAHAFLTQRGYISPNFQKELDIKEDIGNYHKILGIRLNSIKHRCKEKNYPCNLTHPYLSELYKTQKGLCSLTNLPFSFKPSQKPGDGDPCF